jgi:serine/threonine protein kinase
MLLGLHALNKRGLVHCDLKPENILINFDSEKPQDTSVKLIDFGATFEFDGNPFLSVTTPEYLPPEFLQLFSNKRSTNNRQKQELMVKNTYVWSIDVWSVGIIIIEMLIGAPVWMSFKCRTTSFGRDQTLIGLFSSTSR